MRKKPIFLKKLFLPITFFLVLMSGISILSYYWGSNLHYFIMEQKGSHVNDLRQGFQIGSILLFAIGRPLKNQSMVFNW